MALGTWNAIEYQFTKNILSFFHTLPFYPFLEDLAIFVSFLGNKGGLWILLTLLLLLFPKTRTIGVGVALSLLLAFVGGELILKNILMRMRPFTLYNDLLVIPSPSGFSFPSGHTMSSFAAATCVFLYNKKWGVPLLLVALLIGLSRVFLLVHYPTDVLAGLAFGVLAGFGGFRISQDFSLSR